METADDFINSFLANLERRQSSTAVSVPCPALFSDALPAQVQAMNAIRRQVCPTRYCSDVDRAIIGASLGG